MYAQLREGIKESTTVRQVLLNDFSHTNEEVVIANHQHAREKTSMPESSLSWRGRKCCEGIS